MNLTIVKFNVLMHFITGFFQGGGGAQFLQIGIIYPLKTCSPIILFEYYKHKKILK